VFAAIRESDQREVVAKVYDLVDDRSPRHGSSTSFV
jgi:hypothetical protein